MSNQNPSTDFFHKRWHAKTLMILLGISVSIAVTFTCIFRYCLCVEYKDIPWTVILAASGAPWGLFLWYLRDYTKKQDIEAKWKENQTKDKELWQQDFHVQQERIADWQRPSVQLSALYILKGYFEKTSLPEHLRDDESLGEPILNIFRALLVEIGKIEPVSPLAKDIRKVIHSVILGQIDFESAKDVDWTNIDLSGQDFSGKNLSEFRMPVSTLVNAKLQGTNLEKARIWGTNFDDALLSKAVLKGADVSGCTFHRTQINETSFQDASVQGADFSSAIGIDGAIFSDARYSDKTRFPDGFHPENVGMVLVRRGDEKEGEPRWVPVDKNPESDN